MRELKKLKMLSTPPVRSPKAGSTTPFSSSSSNSPAKRKPTATPAQRSVETEAPTSSPPKDYNHMAEIVLIDEGYGNPAPNKFNNRRLSKKRSHRKATKDA